MRRPVIVTRPASPGQRLARSVQQQGWPVAWWPAFDIAPPDDESRVARALATLADYDLAIFVSPNAVHAVAARLAGAWPTSTCIGAVGAATGEAALAELPGARGATLVVPDDREDSGSEAFWRSWQATGRAARRVLLLRAASGRDWIVEQLRGAGATVDLLPVYARLPHALAQDDLQQLQRWLAQDRLPITVVSSTEAVDTLLQQVNAIPASARWLQRGVALATHPRVAKRLHQAGFECVEISDADDSAIVRKLESFSG